MQRRSTRSRPTSSRVLDDVRAAVDRLEGDAAEGARDRGRRRRRAPPPLAAGSARRGQGVSATGSPTTISRSSATAATTWSTIDGAGRAADRARARASASCARHRGRNVAASFAALPPEVRAYARRPELLVITKSTSRSTVHRPGLSRLHRRQALRRSGRRVRRASLPRAVHVDRLQRQSGGHSAAAAQDGQRHSRARACRRAATPARRCSTSSTTYPRDELFQIAEDELLRTAIGILHLGDRQRFRLFVRRDPFERFVVLPHLRAARELHDRAAAEVAGDPDARRSTARAPNSTCTCRSRRWRACMITVRTTPGQIPAVRRARARGAARSRGAPLGRRSQGGADRRAGRGARQRAVPRSSAARSRPPTARTSRRAARCPTSR